MRKLKHIVLLAFIVMLFHTVEEYVAAVWTVDPFMIFASGYLRINPAIFYLLEQLLVLLLLLGFWWRLSYQKLDMLLVAIIGFVFILELLHPYSSIRLHAYYPGLYTGMILVTLGFFYYKELLTKRI